MPQQFRDFVEGHQQWTKKTKVYSLVIFYKLHNSITLLIFNVNIYKCHNKNTHVDFAPYTSVNCKRTKMKFGRIVVLERLESPINIQEF